MDRMGFGDIIHRFQRVEVTAVPNRSVTTPLVSVCIPTYQHGRYITECLDSIVLQKVSFSFEVIIGEDGSLDGTREICLDYASRYPDRIRLFLHRRENNIVINGNPTGRFNFLYCLHQAKGKYIALCDGDDFWKDSSKLQKQVDILNENEDVNVVTHRVETRHEGVVEKNVFKIEWDKTFFSIGDYISHQFAHTSSYLFRRSSIESIPFCLTSCMSIDIPLMILALNTGSGYHIQESMSVYRRNPTGVTQTESRKRNQIKGHYHMWKCIDSFLAPSHAKKLVQRKLAASERLQGYALMRRGNPQSLLFLLRALVRHPAWLIEKSLAWVHGK